MGLRLPSRRDLSGAGQIAIQISRASQCAPPAPPSRRSGAPASSQILLQLQGFLATPCTDGEQRGKWCHPPAISSQEEKCCRHRSNAIRHGAGDTVSDETAIGLEYANSGLRSRPKIAVRTYAQRSLKRDDIDTTIPLTHCARHTWRVKAAEERGSCPQLRGIGAAISTAVVAVLTSSHAPIARLACKAGSAWMNRAKASHLTVVAAGTHAVDEGLHAWIGQPLPMQAHDLKGAMTCGLIGRVAIEGTSTIELVPAPARLRAASSGFQDTQDRGGCR